MVRDNYATRAGKRRESGKDSMGHARSVRPGFFNGKPVVDYGEE